MPWQSLPQQGSRPGLDCAGKNQQCVYLAEARQARMEGQLMPSELTEDNLRDDNKAPSVIGDQPQKHEYTNKDLYLFKHHDYFKGEKTL